MALASPTYECQLLRYKVLKRNIPAGEEPQYYPTPTVLQVELTIDVCLVNDSFVAGYSRPLLRRKTLRFNLDVFKNPDEARQLIRPLLSRLFPMEPDDSYLTFDRFLDQIIPLGLSLGNAVAEAGGKFLALKAQLLVWFEVRNFGMVPAKESAVKEMVKRVGVEVGEHNSVCVVCLEELEVGSYASKLPCSHTFHGNCIEEWLKHSHYCPVCRFKMPT